MEFCDFLYDFPVDVVGYFCVLTCDENCKRNLFFDEFFDAVVIGGGVAALECYCDGSWG